MAGGRLHVALILAIGGDLRRERQIASRATHKGRTFEAVHDVFDEVATGVRVG